MSTTVMRPGSGQRVAAVVAVLARVVLGGLWINEGVVKYHAGFGRADILLVVQSAAQNSRVPGFYKLFTGHVLGPAAGVFGFGIPLLELCLGIALVLGILTLPAALASAGELANYWLADQLITQYPIMAALSVVVATFAPAASRYSITALILQRRRTVPGTLRRWL